MGDFNPVSTSDAVSAQYEQWIYPEPCMDLEALPLQGPHSNFKDFKALHPAYWPAEPYRENRDILVAGCGTMAAACYAYLYPNARVVGIDVSAASLAHEQILKEKYALKNLRLRHLPIENVSSLGEQFDFVASHGVLHHLADPVVGLKALRDVLKPNGVATIMVYGKYGRAGVYILQDLFRLLGLQQNAAGVALVRETLSVVGPNHPIHHYLRVATDLHADTGLVDTFLHRRDKAYSVQDCLALVQQADMVFQGWEEGMLYNYELPIAHLPADNTFRRSMAALSERQMWEATELLRANISAHFFYACRKDRDSCLYRVHFEGDEFLEYIPIPRYTRVILPDPLRGGLPMLDRPPIPPVAVAETHIPVLRALDGRRTVRQCLQAQPITGAAAVALGRELFSFYWRQGYLLFRLTSS